MIQAHVVAFHSIFRIFASDMSNAVQLGLKENWKQFSLLVFINALVGGMVGIERTIFPQFAEEVFHVVSKTSVLSFITAFGITKAAANYYAGRIANKFGRRNLLIWGWVIAIPVPLILLFAPSWTWVVLANILLGISQGFTWSSTVVMKIDLVGERNRGLAMGLNEFSGYLAVGVVAFLTGLLASHYGVVPVPFYLGFGIAILGFIVTLIWVKDTRHHVHREAKSSEMVPLDHVFWDTTLRDKTLSSITQAGLVNNLNDGMIWGLLPILLIKYSFGTERIGLLAAVYPAVWGLGQLFTGKMADHYSKKVMLVWGMWIQGIAILLLPLADDFTVLAIILAGLGMGTALVYPTFLAAIAASTRPEQRAESIGIFRLWRDLGYAIGAVVSGVIADYLGLEYAIFFVGIITLVSGGVIRWRIPS